MKIRKKYEPSERKKVVFKSDEKLTKESFKDSCDINLVVAKYRKSGILPEMRSQGQFLDCSSVPSYQEALDTVRFAQDTFMALPAQLRAECGNDPAVFLDRVQDRAWAEKHGLVDPTPQPADPDPVAAKPATSKSQKKATPNDEDA